MTQQQKDRAPTYPESDGEGTDGSGSAGMVEEKSREGRSEAGPTGSDGDGIEAGSGAAVENSNEETDA